MCIRLDRLEKVIYWELCKKFKFDLTSKRYRHSPQSLRENETHTILWDFVIQTDHLISARRPDLVIVNNNNKKVNLSNSELCRSG